MDWFLWIAYSKLTNKEIRKATMELLGKLHEFQARLKNGNMVEIAQWQTMARAPGSEKQTLWQQHTDSMLSMSQANNTEFNKELQGACDLVARRGFSTIANSARQLDPSP